MSGFRELLVVEQDNNAVSTFRLNFPDVSIYDGDICKLSSEQCMRLAEIKPRELDVLDGSPPCQGFSTAGRRELNDDRNQLFRQFVRLLRDLQPSVFVMENVAGMIKGKMRLIFAEILRELKTCGYQVSARLLNSKYFEVPQSRQRLIFIGVRDDLNTEPSHPMAKSMSGGMIRIDGVFKRYSEKRYGDVIVNQGECTQTLTKMSRFFWNKTTEFGPKSYKLCCSFPEGFEFHGSKSKMKERLGNSVPPFFMKAIAEHVKNEILNS
jgi:DNA (cytosine-5)-methyltransferase 1